MLISAILLLVVSCILLTLVILEGATISEGLIPFAYVTFFVIFILKELEWIL